MNEINVIYKEPGKLAQIRTINNDLKTMHGLVEGYIEVVNIEKDVALICNEEGKLLDLEPNIYVNGINDTVVGPIILAGVSGEDFTSIDDYHSRIYMRELGVAR